jgi:ferredoxin
MIYANMSSMDLEISVLHSRCIGAAVCTNEAEGSFILNAKKKALVTDLSKNSEDVLVNVARNCPVQAIFIYKQKKQLWPEPGVEGLNKQPGRDVKMSFDEAA